MSYTVPVQQITGTADMPVPIGVNYTALVIYNESQYTLTLKAGSKSMYLPAWTGDRLDTAGTGWDGTLTIALQNISSASNAPSAAVLITAFGPGEPVPGTFPVALSRQTNIGNGTVNTSTANAVIVSGETPPNDLVKASPTGYTSATVDLVDTGAFVLQPLSNGAQVPAFQVIAGGVATPAVVKMDNGLIATDGTGQLSTAFATADKTAFLVSNTLGNVNNALLASVTAAATSGGILTVAVSGDTTKRFKIFADGKHEWGPGNATRDTNLYRSGVGTLRTDNAFTAGNGLTVVAGDTSLDGGLWSTDGSGHLTATTADTNVTAPYVPVLTLYNTQNSAITASFIQFKCFQGGPWATGMGTIEGQWWHAFGDSSLHVKWGYDGSSFRVVSGTTQLDNGLIATDGSGNITSLGNITFSGNPVLASLQSGAASGLVFESWNGSAAVKPFSVGGQFSSALAWVDNSGNYNGPIAGGVPTTRNGVAASVPIFTGANTPTVGTAPTGSIWYNK